MRESEHSERFPEFYIFDYSAEKHIKYGSHPPLGGRTGAEGGSKRLAEQSEVSDACFLLRRGWGRGVERVRTVCCKAKRSSKRKHARPTREHGHHYLKMGAPLWGAHGSRRRKEAEARAKRGSFRLLPPSARVGRGWSACGQFAAKRS